MSGAVAPLAGPHASEQLIRAAVARLDGLGSLEALLTDEAIDEVLVNAAGDVWVERDGLVARAGHIPAADLAVVIERILAPLGRRLDRTSPIVDARLPDGSRVCAVIPPVAADGPCLAVRRFRDRALPLERVLPPTRGRAARRDRRAAMQRRRQWRHLVRQDIALEHGAREDGQRRTDRDRRGHGRAAAERRAPRAPRGPPASARRARRHHARAPRAHGVAAAARPPRRR